VTLLMGLMAWRRSRDPAPTSRAVGMTSTTCAIVGGGPAGMMLGLLLARAGVPVTVLEKHPDFLRDIRGDTVHASTLTLLDELGLGPAFARLPHRLIDRGTLQLDAGQLTLSFARLPGRHRHIAWCRSGTSSSCWPPPPPRALLHPASRRRGDRPARRGRSGRRGALPRPLPRPGRPRPRR